LPHSESRDRQTKTFSPELGSAGASNQTQALESFGPGSGWPWPGRPYAKPCFSEHERVPSSREETAPLSFFVYCCELRCFLQFSHPRDSQSEARCTCPYRTICVRVSRPVMVLGVIGWEKQADQAAWVQLAGDWFPVWAVGPGSAHDS
jgi:hypothetical protein